MRYNFPILYLKTETGRVRFYEIWVIGDKDKASIYTKHGIKGGRIIQPYPKLIEKSFRQKEGAYNRALKLATTQWETRINKYGYKANEPKPTIKNAPTVQYHSNNKAIIPMRAYPLGDHEVVYPAYVQPKIDGYRALLHKNGGRYEFLSNTGKSYQHLDHLKKELKEIKILENKNVYLDGELYLEKEHVNVLRSILSTIELNEEQKRMAKQIKFYVFDMFNLKKMDMTYEERYKELEKIFQHKIKNIVLTPTTLIRNEKDIDTAFAKYVKMGYEGIIIRNKRGLYKLRGKSMDVFKSKDIKKDMFTIVGYKEAKGNNRGTVVWEIRCNKDPRKSFWARPMGTREERKKMFKSGKDYIGEKVTVKYFEIDNNGCVTKNPVAFF